MQFTSELSAASTQQLQGLTLDVFGSRSLCGVLACLLARACRNNHECAYSCRLQPCFARIERMAVPVIGPPTAASARRGRAVSCRFQPSSHAQERLVVSIVGSSPAAGGCAAPRLPWSFRRPQLVAVRHLGSPIRASRRQKMPGLVMDTPSTPAYHLCVRA